MNRFLLIRSVWLAVPLSVGLMLSGCSGPEDIVFGPEPLQQIGEQGRQFGKLPEEDRQLLVEYLQAVEGGGALSTDGKLTTTVTGQTVVEVLDDAREWRAARQAAEARRQEEKRQEETALRREREKAAQDAAASRAKEREAAAVASARRFLDRAMNDPSVKPRKYYRALETISASGDMLVLTISITDKDEAVKLCNMMGVGWVEREERGISRVVVKHSGSGSVLAQLTTLPNGAEVCR